MRVTDFSLVLYCCHGTRIFSRTHKHPAVYKYEKFSFVNNVYNINLKIMLKGKNWPFLFYFYSLSYFFVKVVTTYGLQYRLFKTYLLVIWTEGNSIRSTVLILPGSAKSGDERFRNTMASICLKLISLMKCQLFSLMVPWFRPTYYQDSLYFFKLYII